MFANRKIIGATEVDVCGIKFKSKLEARVYKELIKLGYKAEYEPMTSTLLDGFRPVKPWLLDGEPQVIKHGETKAIKRWEYTPDFLVYINSDVTLMLECNGYSNDLHPYKRKMLLHKLDECDGWYYAEVHTLKGLRKTMEWFNKLVQQQNEKSLRD